MLISYITDDWEGRIGRWLLTVNAKTAKTAANIALQAACDHYFHAEYIFLSKDGLPRDLASDPSFFDTLSSTGGSWHVGVIRVGHATRGGPEHSSDYLIESIKFISPRPSDKPDAQDDPTHWRQVLFSCNEHDALTTGTPTPASAASHKNRI